MKNFKNGLLAQGQNNRKLAEKQTIRYLGKLAGGSFVLNIGVGQGTIQGPTF